MRFLEYSQHYSTQPCTLTRKSPSRTVDAAANLWKPQRSSVDAPGSVTRQDAQGDLFRVRAPCVASACAAPRTGSAVPPWFVEIAILSSEDTTSFSSAPRKGRRVASLRSGMERSRTRRADPRQADVSLLAIQKSVGAQCY